MNYLSGDSSLKTVWPSLLVSLLGLAVMGFAGFYRPKPGSKIFVKLGEWATSPVPYALLFILVWAYFETLAVQRNNELAALRNDEMSITKAVDRFVIPRQLTDDQVRRLGDFLKRFPPVDVTISVVQGDEEAGNYAQDFKKAFDRASWQPKGVTFTPDPDIYIPDLRFVTKETPDHAKAEEVSPEGKPKMSTLIMIGFGLAGIPVGSSSGSFGDQTVTQDSIVITVGHRRRDSYALPCIEK